MNPTKHPSNNDVLGAPPGVSIDECQDLPITRVVFHPSGRAGVMSYWQPSPEELRLLNEGRAVYLSCWGHTHPPVILGVDGDGVLS